MKFQFYLVRVLAIDNKKSKTISTVPTWKKKLQTHSFNQSVPSNRVAENYVIYHELGHSSKYKFTIWINNIIFLFSMSRWSQINWCNGYFNLPSQLILKWFHIFFIECISMVFHLKRESMSAVGYLLMPAVNHAHILGSVP